MVLRPVWKLQRALEERNAWLLLREERIIQLEQEIRGRDDLLSLREQRIRQLEVQIEQAQEVVCDRENGVRERERTIALLETQLRELKITDPDDELRIEIDRRGALLRQREARIRTLEIEIRGQEAELHLFRTALDQAEDILRKRDAELALLERQPDWSPEPEHSAESCSDWWSASDHTPAKVIQEWQQAALDFARLDLKDGQELIDPYVLERSLHGHPTRLLIVTRQAADWYDRFDLTRAPVSMHCKWCTRVTPYSIAVVIME